MLVLHGLMVSVLLLMTVWVKRYATSKRRQWTLTKNIPGPKGWPIFGTSLSFTGSAAETFNVMCEWIEKYGTTICAWIGPKLYFFITEPADLQIILGNQKIRNRDFYATEALKPFCGEGLFSSRDEQWRLHRKLINPAFHIKILESYVEIFGRKAEILTEKIRDLADGRTTDISHQLSLCTLDAICETAIGVKMDIQINENCKFEKAICEGYYLVHNRTIHPWLLLDWLYPWTSDGRKAKSTIQTIHEFSESVIASKLAAYKKGGSKKISGTTGGDKKISSFLDLLIDTSEGEGQSLTAEEIRDEVTTLAAAGMETTANTMAFTLVLLGMHPEYQDKIDEELTYIFQDEKRIATSEDLHNMKDLENVIKETLRLFPSGSVMPREISEDLEISNGYILPAGSSAMCFSYPTHRNPAYFPEPERFWPERWTPENSVGRHPFAYVPFSAGPRNCIGQKYAMMAMKATLSSLLKRYRFSCDCYTMKDLEQLEVSATTRSAIGYKLQIHKINTC